MPKKLTQDEYLRKVRAVHGDTYDYSKVVYVRSASKIEIYCRMHGLFSVTANHHVQGVGCKKCQYEGMKLTLEDFISRSRQQHQDRDYRYSSADLSNTNTKVVVTCGTHGDFSVAVGDHLRGKGCRACHFNSTRMSQEEFIARAKEAHGDTYDYSGSVYISMRERVKVRCREHGEFKLFPHNHFRGSGCRKCSSGSGIDLSAPGTLYYVRVDSPCGNLRWKIGITGRSVKARFTATDYSRLTVLRRWKFTVMREAYEIEQNILSKFSEHLSPPPTDLISGGNTETFAFDVLGLEGSPKRLKTASELRSILEV